MLTDESMFVVEFEHVTPWAGTGVSCSPSYLTPNPVLIYPTPHSHILLRPTLASPAILLCPTSSYPPLTTSYPVAPPYPILHRILLPSYLTSNPVLLYPTPSNHILPRPTLDPPTILPCPTSSYPILPHPTAILPHPTSSYTGSFCHPTISYPVVRILSHLITSCTMVHNN